MHSKSHFQVDLRKVNIQVLRPWISKKIVELLGFEDDVVIEYVYSLLEENDVCLFINPKPNPKQMQIKLTGFLEDATPRFMNDLWKLLISAQDSVGGIPQEFLELKKKEILLKKVLIFGSDF